MSHDERLNNENVHEQATSTSISRQDVTKNSGPLVATNLGSIHYTFDNGSRQPQQPPAVRDVGLQLANAISLSEKQFVGRNKEIQEIAELLVTEDEQPAPSRVVAISGLGGIGKTQLMLRFAQLYRHIFKSIIWLDASSESNLRQSLVTLAQCVAEVPDKQRVEAVEQDVDGWVFKALVWLSRTASPGWLLLMDNYDDPSNIQDYSGPSGYDIRHYFPHQRRGSIVITSRASLDIFDYRILLSKISDVEESLQILYQRSGRAATDPVDQGARQLAYRLDGLPLALSTAGQFLYHAPDVTFTKYLSLYQREWSRLGANSKLLPEFSGSSKDRLLFTTWNISYERVLHINPDAARLLRFLVYFDPRGVWRDIFRYCKDGSPDWLLRMSGNEFLFYNLMKCLQDHSFVSTDSDRRVYTIHQCVHDWLRAIAKTTSEDINLLSTACIMLADHCVSDEKPSFWYDDFRIESHLLHVWEYMCDLQQRPSEETVDESLALQDIAVVLTRRGRLKEAEAMSQRVLACFEHALGPDHSLTLDTVSNLSIIYRDQGKLKEAEATCQRALVGREQTLGPDHTSTLDTVGILADIYRAQGKLKEAEAMYQRALAGFEKALGLDHPMTLAFVSNLGSLYHAQGKLKEAEATCQRALVGKEQTLGPDHSSTLNTVSILGTLYRAQGKLKEAEVMYKRALAGREQALGPDHSSTLHTVSILGNLYHAQRKFKEAEVMYERALAGKEQAVGPDHSSTLTIVSNLALLYRNQGKLKEAEAMYQRALAGYWRAMSRPYVTG